MRIIAVSMVKNEADVIESFVRHTLGFVDRLYVADHGSTDGTYEILCQVRSEGLPLEIERVYGLEYRQREVINTLARRALAAGADIIMPLDADEFVVNTSDAEDIRSVLEGLDLSGIYSYGMIPARLREPEREADRFILRRATDIDIRSSYEAKVVVGARAYVAARPLEIVQGNHFCSYSDTGEKVASVQMPRLNLLHYAERSQGQRMSKAMVGWVSNVARYGRTTSYASGWQTGFREILAGSFTESVQFESPQVFDASGQRMYELRYTRADGVDYIANMMRQSEELAQCLYDTTTLARHELITVIVPYLGAVEPFRRTVTSVTGSLYPYTELVVLAAMPLPQGVRAELAAAKVVTADATELGRSVTGDYVKLLLPGRSLAPLGLTRELGYLLAEPGRTLVWQLGSDVSESYTEFTAQLPYTADVYSAEANGVFADKWLLSGRYPAGGISAALMQRAVLAAVDYLAGYFLDSRALEFSMCRAILQANGRLGNNIHFIQAAYTERNTALALDDILWHQLEWFYLAEQEQLDIATRQEFGRKYLQNATSLMELDGIASCRLYNDYQNTVGAVLAAEDK